MPSKKSLMVLAAAGCVLALAVVIMIQSANAQKQGDKPGAAPGKGGQAAPQRVTVEKTEELDVLRIAHTFVGTVTPTRESSVGSAVDARVTDFPFNEGDRVEAGQTLAQLLTGQLDIQLAGANADAELARQEYEELKASVPLEVEQARSRVQSRKAAADYANSRLQRTKALVARNTMTADQLEEASSLADQAAQAYAEAKAALAITEGPRQTAITQAEAKLEVKIQAAKAIDDQIKKHTIKAPFDGYVVEEHTEIGQWVAKAGLVAKVVELDQVDVEIMVLENLLPHLQVGQPVESVEITALGKSFPGVVQMIVPQADPRSRSFPVKVRVDNTIHGQAIKELLQSEKPRDDRYADRTDRPLTADNSPDLPQGLPDIKAGMFARVTLVVKEIPHAIMVHKDAVVHGGAKPIVYVVDNVQGQVGTTRPVPVELGGERGNYIQVIGSVAPGDLVVVEGNERVRPQMPVTAHERPTSLHDGQPQAAPQER